MHTHTQENNYVLSHHSLSVNQCSDQNSLILFKYAQYHVSHQLCWNTGFTVTQLLHCVKTRSQFLCVNLISLRNLVLVCVCPLLASCRAHSCVLIGSRSGHDTAESGRDNVIVSLMETLVTHFPFPLSLNIFHLSCSIVHHCQRLFVNFHFSYSFLYRCVCWCVFFALQE